MSKDWLAGFPTFPSNPNPILHKIEMAVCSFYLILLYIVRLLILERKERDFCKGLHKAECRGSSCCCYSHEGTCC